MNSSDDPTLAASQVPTAEPAGSPAPARPSSSQLARGAVVSRYRVESVLGEGGMGVVYLARQEKPDREVALKVVRPGYATEKMLKRFEMEAEVLGRLLHPGIAQIYEAGVWTSPEREREGLPPAPFFAMELVRGVPLTRYAAERKLSVRERLELVARVCDGVQHAHQKGVIHRDLKPGNILVTDEGQPKILDFGVARATDSDIQQTTMSTDVGAIVGTIPYMSPEQVSGEPAELDTRSDVYALGVIAYELLVGRLPYSLERKMIHEAARIIREDEPTRLSSIDRALRGDVETIVAHALEKDKARRYGGASALAADIRHYLADEPIAARPASTWYQLAKFSRRNKGLVGGIGASFLVLVAGLLVSLYAFEQARDERDLKGRALVLATQNEKRAIESERRARDEADRVRKVSDFQSDMLGQVDPTEAGKRLTEGVNRRFVEGLKTAGVPESEWPSRTSSFSDQWRHVNATDAARDLIDATILRPAIAAIERQFRDQPTVEAQLKQVLADRYRELGLYDAALPLQTSALETRRRLLGEEHPDTLTSLGNMGGLLADRGKEAQAEPYYSEVLQKNRRMLGDDHPDTLRSIHNMGGLLNDQGKYAEAEVYCREALEGRRRVLGEEHPDTLSSISNVGFLLESQGRLAEAEPHYREALEKRRRVLGEEHPDTLTSINNLSALLQSQGKLAEAEPYCREAMEKRRRVLGEEHPDTLSSISNLGFLLEAQGRPAEAEPYCREALEKSRRVLGEQHAATLGSLINMGALLKAQGRLGEAEPYCREALEKSRRVLGEEHAHTLTSINNVAGLLSAQGRHAEAEPYYREALEKSRRVLGEEHPKTLVSISNMGFLLKAQGRLAEAEPYWREALEKFRRVMGEEHPNTVTSIDNMGFLLKAQGRLAEAEPYHREALEKFRRVLGEEHPSTLISINNMGHLLQLQGRLPEAERHYSEAMEKSRRVLGEEHPETLRCINNMGVVLQAQGRLAEAEPYHREALEKRRRLLGEEHPDTVGSINNMGALLLAQNKPAEAVELLAPAEGAARRAFTGANAVRLASLLATLGRSRAALPFEPDRFTLAEANLLEAHSTFVSTRGERHKDTRGCAQALVDLYIAWHGAQPADGYDTKAAAWKVKLDAISPSADVGGPDEK